MVYLHLHLLHVTKALVLQYTYASSLLDLWDGRQVGRKHSGV